jgi:molecular chaperone HscA
MALLQISEPGMSTAPHQHRLAVGIDLGTTNSLVATVRNSIPEVLNDEEGRLYFLLSFAIFRMDMRTSALKHRQNKVTTQKYDRVSQTFYGRGLKDNVMPKIFRMTLSMRQAWCNSEPSPASKVRSKFPPRYSQLRQQTEDALGDDLVGAVITVPAYFDDAQRQAAKMRPSWLASMYCDC